MWTFTQLGLLLGVSTNQVWTWHKRRATSGFPEAIGSVIAPVNGGRKRAPFFDAGEVADWFSLYKPWAKKFLPIMYTSEERKKAHAQYVQGHRDVWTLQGNREYNRERRRQDRARSA